MVIEEVESVRRRTRLETRGRGRMKQQFSRRGASEWKSIKVLLVGPNVNEFTVNVFRCYFYCQDLSQLMSHTSSVLLVSVCVCVCVC